MFQPEANLKLAIIPFSNYDLVDETMCKFFDWYQMWRDHQPCKFDEIRRSVFMIKNIERYATELLQQLFHIFVSLKFGNKGYYDVLESLLEILRQLETTADGKHILNSVMVDPKNRPLIRHLHSKLLTALDELVSVQIKDCAKDNELSAGID